MAELSPTKRAKVHGYIESLSPMKDSQSGSRKYFTGKITDGNISTRIVGFYQKIHEALSTFKAKHEPVSVDNCEVKESTYSANLEILVRKSSDLQKSPLEFDVDPAKFDTMKQPCVSLD